MPAKMSDSLNTKESRVLRSFPPSEGGVFPFLQLAEIAKIAFGTKRGTSPKSKGNSWTRNSLRKLLALGLVAMKAKRSGFYSLTEKGEGRRGPTLSFLPSESPPESAPEVFE
jgi:hypothetical protein